MDPGEVVDCLNQQTRSDNEHHRESDLGYHKSTTGLLTPSSAGTPCALLKYSRHATCSQAPERHESEKQSSPSREAERNQQDGQIDCEITRTRDAGRVGTDQRPDTSAG